MRVRPLTWGEVYLPPPPPVTPWPAKCAFTRPGPHGCTQSAQNTSAEGGVFSPGGLFSLMRPGLHGCHFRMVLGASWLPGTKCETLSLIRAEMRNPNPYSRNQAPKCEAPSRIWASEYRNAKPQAFSGPRAQNGPHLSLICV